MLQQLPFDIKILFYHIVAQIIVILIILMIVYRLSRGNWNGHFSCRGFFIFCVIRYFFEPKLSTLIHNIIKV